MPGFYNCIVERASEDSGILAILAILSDSNPGAAMVKLLEKD